MLVLNVGGKNSWIEFCHPCGETMTLKNAAGEVFTLNQIFEGTK